jgi:hypothetical protein
MEIEMTVVSMNQAQRKASQPMHFKTVATAADYAALRERDATEWLAWETRRRNSAFQSQLKAHTERLAGAKGEGVLNAFNWSDDLLRKAADLHVLERCTHYAMALVLENKTPTNEQLVRAMLVQAADELRMAAGACLQSGLRVLTAHAELNAWNALHHELKVQVRSLDKLQ